MKDKTVIMQSAVADVSPEDFMHPGLRMCRFVFCDDQPNDNGQGVAAEDFDSIIKTGIGTPIKMKFYGQAAGGHTGSIPIGYIKDMFKRVDDGINQLVADAVLFADEYPEEVQFLADSHEKGEAPGISWELKYSESIIKDGIEWLKGLITRAATFVGHPAYGTRTKILALASNRELSDEEFVDAFKDIFGTISPKNENEGGNNRMEEELQSLKDKVAELTSQLEAKDTEISSRDTSIETLTTERDELKTTVSEYQTRELIASRTAALVEAGITLPEDPDKLAFKQAHWAAMSEEVFTSTVEDLKEAISTAAKKIEKPQESLAEKLQNKRPASLPRFSSASVDGTEGDEQPTFSGLKTKFKTISRTSASAESE